MDSLSRPKIVVNKSKSGKTFNMRWGVESMGPAAEDIFNALAKEAGLYLEIEKIITESSIIWKKGRVVRFNHGESGYWDNAPEFAINKLKELLEHFYKVGMELYLDTSWEVYKKFRDGQATLMEVPGECKYCIL